MFKSKFSFFFLSIIISMTFLFSCKKDRAAVDGTKWSVDSYNFNSNNKGGVLLETDTGALFGASTSSNDYILILFKQNPSAGVYNVVNTQNKPNSTLYEDNDCSMLITNKSGGGEVYLALTDDAGFVNVSVSGKKITASFSNVKLGYLTNTGSIFDAYASGTIIEK